jgi:transposase-like protein
MNQALWGQWRQRLERQRASGLSIAAFCRKEGVSQAAFHAWKRRLRPRDAGRPASREGAGTRRSRKRPAAVSPRRRRSNSPRDPVTAKPGRDFVQLPVEGTRSSPWIELTLIDGTVVRIGQENLAALKTLLRVLRGDDADELSGEVRHA